MPRLTQRSMFLLSGQGCITLKRLFVHESIYQALTEAVISCAQHQKLGETLPSKPVIWEQFDDESKIDESLTVPHRAAVGKVQYAEMIVLDSNATRACSHY